MSTHLQVQRCMNPEYDSRYRDIVLPLRRLRQVVDGADLEEESKELHKLLYSLWRNFEAESTYLVTLRSRHWISNFLHHQMIQHEVYRLYYKTLAGARLSRDEIRKVEEIYMDHLFTYDEILAAA